MRPIYITALKSFGMLLVLLGHSFPPTEIIAVPEGFLLFDKWIYSFHMPLFVAISGFLFAKYNVNNSFSQFIVKKAVRLLLPYVFFITLTTIIKALLSRHALNPIELNLHTILFNLLYPGKAAVVAYWFLATLFSIFLFFPIYKRVMEIRIVNAFFITTALVILHIWNPLQDINVFSLNRLFDLFIYFWCGCLIARYEEKLMIVFDNCFTLIFSGLALWGMNLMPEFIALSLAKGLTGLIMAWSFCVLYTKHRLAFLDFLNGKTFSVYLMHGIIVIGAATVLRKIGVGFYIFFPVVLTSGCIISLLFIYLIRYLKWDKQKMVRIIFGL